MGWGLSQAGLEPGPVLCVISGFSGLSLGFAWPGLAGPGSGLPGSALGRIGVGKRSSWESFHPVDGGGYCFPIELPRIVL